MKAIFFGTGSIGKRHTINLKQLLPSVSIRSFKSDYSRNWSALDIDDPFDIAFICNPTYLHMETVIECAKRKIPSIFIEKPIDANAERLDEAIDTCDVNGCSTYVAYPFRHSKEINSAKITGNYRRIVCRTDINDWGKESYSFDGKKGGGALLELSHEIDLAEHLFGKIEAIDGRIGNFRKAIKDAEDYGLLTAWHEDGSKTDIELFLTADSTQRFIEYGTTVTETLHYRPSNGMYLEQMRWFLVNKDKPRMTNNLSGASRLFRMILEVRG